MISDIIFEKNFLSKEECQYIINLHSDLEFERSKFVGKLIPKVDVFNQISQEVVINKEDQQMIDILNKIKDTVKTINDKHFFVDVNLDDFEAKLMKFNGDEKAFITKHSRVYWLSKEKHVKIFAGINLTPAINFEGNEIIMNTFVSQVPTLQERKEEGILCVFPGLKRFEITPILKGTRYMLFIDYNGPCWK